jgi:hypothetical protein
MRPMPVAVRHIARQRRLQMPSTHDQHPVQQLTAHLDTLLAFRDGASRWLYARGIAQWSEPWPTEDLMAEGMLRNIEAGETFIAWDDRTPATTITVDRWANPDLWTPAERPEPALYAHKLTVARTYAAQDLGAELLNWASTRAANSRRSGSGLTCGPATTSSSSTTETSASRTCGHRRSRTIPRERSSSVARARCPLLGFERFRWAPPPGDRLPRTCQQVVSNSA